MFDRRKASPNFDLRLNEMRHRAINVSATWFLWVNALFSSFILGRRYFAAQNISAFSEKTTPVPEISTLLILCISAATLFILRLSPDRYTARMSTLIHGVMVVLSLCWSICFYVLMAEGNVRLVFPFSALLIFTALISLYFDGKVLHSFTVPVWLVIMASNIIFSTEFTSFNAMFYLLMGVLFESGRRILRRWFVLAIRREQENADLIDQLQALANHDPLTGIANRRAFQILLDKALQRQQQTNSALSIIMLDVDYFKKYNDRYGHQAGDECLIALAHCFANSTRITQGVAARVGGEEFIILLQDTTEQQAEAVALRLQQNIKALALVHASSSVSTHVTVSQGIATWSRDKSATQLISQADAALYDAKEAGRNRWHVFRQSEHADSSAAETDKATS